MLQCRCGEISETKQQGTVNRRTVQCPHPNPVNSYGETYGEHRVLGI